MSLITVLNHVSLDGVMQSPGRPDEDTRGGFDHGGWAASDTDEVLMETVGPHMGSISAGALLLGRRTYEDFFAFWPGRTDNPFTAVLDAATKYVVSSTLSEPLPWQHSALLRSVEEVAALKEKTDSDLLVMGSGVLVRSLLERELVDRLVVVVHPLLLGKGTRMFTDGGRYEELRLTDSVTTPKGVIVATYERRSVVHAASL
jgi:dihydrofolate reductase